MICDTVMCGEPAVAIVNSPVMDRSRYVCRLCRPSFVGRRRNGEEMYSVTSL